MSVSSVSGSSPQVILANKPATKPPTINPKPKDADGDRDGDTSKNDSGGVDVTG